MSDSTELAVGSKNHFFADVGLAVAGAIAIAMFIYHPGSGGLFSAGTIWGLLLSAAGVLCALAAGTKLVTVHGPQNFYGGLVMAGLGILALILSADLPGMRGFAFGPGTAPRLFAIGLGLLSFALAFIGLTVDGPQIARYRFRGLIIVVASVFLFAATIRQLGLVPCTFLTIFVSAFATVEVRWKESLIWAVILTAFCSILFPYGLNLPFQLWPRFW